MDILEASRLMWNTFPPNLMSILRTLRESSCREVKVEVVIVDTMLEALLGRGCNWAGGSAATRFVAACEPIAVVDVLPDGPTPACPLDTDALGNWGLDSSRSL